MPCNRLRNRKNKNKNDEIQHVDKIINFAEANPMIIVCAK